jgi:hypothetical protein
MMSISVRYTVMYVLCLPTISHFISSPIILHALYTAYLSLPTTLTGLCIEANPMYWRDLSFRDCQVVAAVVGQDRMEKVDFALRDVYGGIVKPDFDNRRKDGATTFYTVPLLEVLQNNNAPKVIDYLSLDVEGAESYIMSAFPFADYSFKVMTVERPKPDLQDLLIANGYEYVRDICKFGETLWVKKEYKNELNLGAIESMIARFPYKAQGSQNGSSEK